MGKTYEIALIGTRGCGKTALIVRLCIEQSLRLKELQDLTVRSTRVISMKEITFSRGDDTIIITKCSITGEVQYGYVPPLFTRGNTSNFIIICADGTSDIGITDGYNLLRAYRLLCSNPNSYRGNTTRIVPMGISLKADMKMSSHTDRIGDLTVSSKTGFGIDRLWNRIEPHAMNAPSLSLSAWNAVNVSANGDPQNSYDNRYGPIFRFYHNRWPALLRYCHDIKNLSSHCELYRGNDGVIGVRRLIDCNVSLKCGL